MTYEHRYCIKRVIVVSESIFKGQDYFQLAVTQKQSRDTFVIAICNF